MDFLKALVPRLLAKPRPPEMYYALQFIGRPDGSIERTCQSQWAGFENDDVRRELRKARRFVAEDAGSWRETLGRLKQDCLLVRTLEDLRLFYLAGGNALIESALAESRTELAELLSARVCVRTEKFGFTALSALPRAALNRAPTPRERMRVLKRDEFRCRICGRRAADEVDVQLHVHHIRPWATGGVTVIENLITLCHTCHTGLQPHYEWSLFDMVGSGEGRAVAAEAGKEYREGLVLYWEKLQEVLSQRNGDPPRAIQSCLGSRARRLRARH